MQKIKNKKNHKLAEEAWQRWTWLKLKSSCVSCEGLKPADLHCWFVLLMTCRSLPDHFRNKKNHFGGFVEKSPDWSLTNSIKLETTYLHLNVNKFSMGNLLCFLQQVRIGLWGILNMYITFSLFFFVFFAKMKIAANRCAWEANKVVPLTQPPKMQQRFMNGKSKSC